MTKTVNKKPPKTQLSTLPVLAKKINTAHQQCESAARSAVQHALEAGKLLIQAKEQVPHGGWLPWLNENCECSERSARTYMRVARELPNIEGNRQRAADLSLRQAIKLLESPRETTATLMDGPEFEDAGDALNAFAQQIWDDAFERCKGSHKHLRDLARDKGYAQMGWLELRSVMRRMNGGRLPEAPRRFAKTHRGEDGRIESIELLHAQGAAQ